MLIEKSSPTICYECHARQRGLTGTENDHMAGRNNSDITVQEIGNNHRALSDMQGDWPVETLQNPSGNPLIAIAGALRRFLDLLQFYIDRVIDGLPQAVETLNTCLVSIHGEDWWHQPAFAPFTIFTRAVCRR